MVESPDPSYRPCAGVMLMNPAGLIFVGQRLDHSGEAWQMPQGGIDPGESPRAAALRELTEETGVLPSLVEVIAETEGWLTYDLPKELQGKLWGGRYRGQAQKWVLMRFHGSDADIDIATAEPEFSAWTWLPASELVARIVPFKRTLYAQVLDAFAPHMPTA